MKYYTITHDRDQCIGCGSCELEAPQTWELDEKDGLANLKDSELKGKMHVREIDELDYEDNKRACETCPMQIICIAEKNK